MLKGQIISGDYSKLIIRQKSGNAIELGELLIANTNQGRILLQVYDLQFGSQISQQNMELISGMRLENNCELNWMEPELRNYNIAIAKSILKITNDNKSSICKILPNFFSEVRELETTDLSFFENFENPIYFGNLRSGSKIINSSINLDGNNVLSHHILVAATTGRGKSNLTSVILWNLLEQNYAGILVLDPHDEYYGRNKKGLKDHPNKNKISYYTRKNPPQGTNTLKINLSCVKPNHMSFFNFSDVQKQTMYLFYKKYNQSWIEAIIEEKNIDGIENNPGTMNALKRKLMSLLNLEYSNEQIFCNGVFDLNSGETTISNICNELENSNMVIIDTSDFSGESELLIGNLITTEIYSKYKNYKMSGVLNSKPQISIILEEAPRVLGKKSTRIRT
jgi:hypothetical protein